MRLSFRGLASVVDIQDSHLAFSDLVNHPVISSEKAPDVAGVVGVIFV